MGGLKTARKACLLPAGAVIVLLALLATQHDRAADAWWRIKPPADGMDTELHSVTEWGTIDCGTIRIVGPDAPDDSLTDAGLARMWAEPDACVAAAAQAHRPFRVRVNCECIESSCATAWVGTSQGKLYEVYWRETGGALTKTECKPAMLSRGHVRDTFQAACE